LWAFKNSELKISTLKQSRQDLIFRGLEIIFAVSEFANRAGAAFFSFRLGHLKSKYQNLFSLSLLRFLLNRLKWKN